MILARVCSGYSDGADAAQLRVQSMYRVSEMDISTQKATGYTHVAAADSLSVQHGDLVLCISKQMLSHGAENENTAADLSIVGVVDSIGLLGNRVYQKRIGERKCTAAGKQGGCK